MSILVDHQLRDLGPDILDPFDSKMVQPTSIDIRLGNQFRISKHHSLEAIDLAQIPGEDEITELHEVPLYRAACGHCEGRGERRTISARTPWVRCQECEFGWVYDLNGRFVLHAGQAVLAATLERIMVPENLAMELVGKSSIARLFVIPIAAAGYFDPGWQGVGTLEIVNLNSVPVVLRPGLKICQSRWMTLDGVPTHLYGSAEAGSHYQGAAGVDGSRYEG